MSRQTAQGSFQEDEPPDYSSGQKEWACLISGFAPDFRSMTSKHNENHKQSPEELSAVATELVRAARDLANAIQLLADRAPRDPDALITAEQLADRLQLSPRTLKDLAAAGMIPHRRFGKHYRFSQDDVAEIVRRAAKKAPPSARRFQAAS
jgi:excisionase family DNA binding protein